MAGFLGLHALDHPLQDLLIRCVGTKQCSKIVFFTCEEAVAELTIGSKAQAITAPAKWSADR
jgi:hypothetical protein